MSQLDEMTSFKNPYKGLNGNKLTIFWAKHKANLKRKARKRGKIAKASRKGNR